MIKDTGERSGARDAWGKVREKRCSTSMLSLSAPLSQHLRVSPAWKLPEPVLWRFLWRLHCMCMTSH